MGGMGFSVPSKTVIVTNSHPPVDTGCSSLMARRRTTADRRRVCRILYHDALGGNFSEEAGTGMTGDLLGAYDSTDTTWQAGIIGTWSGIPTDFGGYWHDSRSYNNAAYLDWATVNDCRQGNEGVFGLLETADGHYDFFAMGRYYEPALRQKRLLDLSCGAVHCPMMIDSRILAV